MPADAEKLLTRADFRRLVFERDKYTCVVPWCDAKADDPHHITERRLWGKDDPYPEGYLLSNGASLCEYHHRHAETGAITPQALRHWLDLPTVLPKMMNPLLLYDKWGNPIESVRGERIKYPKTPYLPFSESIDNEDRTIQSACLLHKPLMVTVKMDGSCVTMTNTDVAARNGETANKPHFDMLKAWHAQRYKNMIPRGIRLFGEWLFAKHSIHYVGSLAVKDYFMVYAVYDEAQELFYDWLGVENFCRGNGFTPVRIVGSMLTYDKEYLLANDVTSVAKEMIAEGHEGVVVRSAYPFHYTQFAENVAKYRRRLDDKLPTTIIKNELTEVQGGK